MAAPLDLDQLRTFIAIADTGSFTRASEMVFKTQSAVSMQMRRLEERIGKRLFIRDGRSSRLSDDGEKLIAYARRMVRLSDETLAAFDDNRLQGVVRVGLPDDYAERFLPDVLARFSRSNPKVEVEVICETTVNLVGHINDQKIDLAIITYNPEKGPAEVIRREPLLWVTSAQHSIHEQEVLPLAFGRPTCLWRKEAMSKLDKMGRSHRILYSSWSANVIAAAVVSGLAVSVLPESAVRPGMRVLSEYEGFPALSNCEIALLRNYGAKSDLVNALAEHIVESLDNISAPVLTDQQLTQKAKATQLAHQGRRLRPNHMMPGW